MKKLLSIIIVFVAAMLANAQTWTHYNATNRIINQYSVNFCADTYDWWIQPENVTIHYYNIYSPNTPLESFSSNWGLFMPVNWPRIDNAVGITVGVMGVDSHAIAQYSNIVATIAPGVTIHSYITFSDNTTTIPLGITNCIQAGCDIIAVPNIINTAPFNSHVADAALYCNALGVMLCIGTYELDGSLDSRPNAPEYYNLENQLACARVRADGTLYHSNTNAFTMGFPGWWMRGYPWGSADRYADPSATSAACAAGLAALLMKQHPEGSAEDVVNHFWTWAVDGGGFARVDAISLFRQDFYHYWPKHYNPWKYTD